MKKHLFLFLFLFPFFAFAQKPKLVVPLGHSAPVELIALSPDGRFLASFDRDKVLNLWLAESGANLWTFDVVGKYKEIHFSNDSQFLICIESNGGLVIKDLFSMDEILRTSALIERQPIMMIGTAKVTRTTLLERPYLTSVDTQIIERGYGYIEPAIIDTSGNVIQEERVFPPSRDTLFYLQDTSYQTLPAKVISSKKVYGASLLEDYTLILLEGDSVKSIDLKSEKTISAWYCPGEKKLSSNGRFCLVLKEKWELRDPISGTLIRSLPIQVVDPYAFQKFTFVETTAQVLVQFSDTLQLWELNNGEKLYETKLQNVEFEGISSDGKVLIFESFGKPVQETKDMDILVLNQYGSGNLKFYNWSTKDTIAQAKVEEGNGILATYFNRNKGQLYTGAYNGSLQLWDVLKELQKYSFGNSELQIATKAGISEQDHYSALELENQQRVRWDFKSNTLSSFLPGQKEYGLLDNILSAIDSTKEYKIEWPEAPWLYGMMVRVPTEYVNLQPLNGLRNLRIIQHQSEINAVSFSSSGRFLISTSKDKTNKIFRLDEQYEPFPKQKPYPEPLATLVYENNQKWIVTAPDGLFDASPLAMQELYYVVPYLREWIVIELDQLKARYYEPGLLSKLMGASEERLRPAEAFEALKLYPKVEAKIQNNQLNIQLKARNGGIGKISIFINDKEVIEEANPLPRRENAKRDSIVNYNLLEHKNFFFRHPDSTNIVSIRAYNKEGWLKSQAVELDYKYVNTQVKGQNRQGAEAAWVGQLAPKLYVVSVGTSDYTGTQLDLKYADQDAKMMAKALASLGTSLFTNGDSLEVHCLTTTSADSTGLEDSSVKWQFADRTHIESVFKEIKAKAKAEDVVVVYFSGHGVSQSGQDQTQFYYLTQGVASEDDLDDPATLNAYTISSEELTKWINDIPALKQVLIIDACNSGQIVENLTGSTKSMNSSQIRALDRMKDRTGMFVLSGSASNKVSYEASEYGQGLLTYALLQGMLGLATRKDTEGKEIIDVMKLFQYARDEVPRLAASVNGIQTPMLGFPSRAASFDIGILDERSKESIVLSNKKPIMVKSVFLNKNTFQDDLKLAESLEVVLRKESEKGSNADLIYVDVYDYPGAYSVSGLYEVKDGIIKIDLKLFKDRQDPVDLQIPVEQDPQRLIKRIQKAIEKQLSKN